MYLDFLFAQLWIVIPLMTSIITLLFGSSMKRTLERRRDIRYQIKNYELSTERYERKTQDYLEKTTD